MSVLWAVLAVGVGSLLFRLVPLLGTRRRPDELSRIAGWTGLAVIAAIAVRSVLMHDDPCLPAAPLFAGLSVAAGLVLTFRGRSVLVAVGIGCSTYLIIGAAVAVLI
ncbi:MAG: hypothetical protein JWR85_2176 [Marmoricola sp.]|nr:hypothetical protein [Marmoricola sp.]